MTIDTKVVFADAVDTATMRQKARDMDYRGFGLTAVLLNEAADEIDRLREQLAMVRELPESMTRYKRWIDSYGERTGSMVPHESGGWVSFGLLLKRVNEIAGKRVPELESD